MTPRTEAGKRLLHSDVATTGWGPSVVRDFLARAVEDIEFEARDAILREVRAEVEGLRKPYDGPSRPKDERNPAKVRGGQATALVRWSNHFGRYVRREDVLAVVDRRLGR